MKKILILGSRGQIGSHLLDFLKKKNLNIEKLPETGANL
jgi:dTDP-4-dehydrorhamnose reductase